MNVNFSEFIIYKTRLLTQTRFSVYFQDVEDHRSLQCLDVYYPSMETVGSRVGKSNKPCQADANRRALDLAQCPQAVVDCIDFAIECRLH